MTVAYCTNIWNHHQGPVCRELAKQLGNENFRMLLHQPLDHPRSVARSNMGWNLMPPNEPWIIGPPASMATADYAEHRRIADGCDVLIYNSELPYLSQSLLERRHRAGKINMRMGERFFKMPLPWWAMFSPKKWAGRILTHLRFETARVHFLTMSHWCAEDLHYYRACRGRIWRWGYLTAVSEKCCEKPKRDKVHVGWCGRLIDWKRVDMLIAAIGKLSAVAKQRCQVTIIGSGDQEASLRMQASQLGQNSIVTFKPSVTSSEVADFMRGLDIYVFPSNRQEGWGAALLEAMDKGCAVIANKAAGSTLEVVKHGVNGLVFEDGDVDALAQCLESLVLDGEKRDQMGREAWKTMQDWSPAAGARRLIALLDSLHSGNCAALPKDGLCALVG